MSSSDDEVFASVGEDLQHKFRKQALKNRKLRLEIKELEHDLRLAHHKAHIPILTLIDLLEENPELAARLRKCLSPTSEDIVANFEEFIESDGPLTKILVKCGAESIVSLIQQAKQAPRGLEGILATPARPETSSCPSMDQTVGGGLESQQ